MCCLTRHWTDIPRMLSVIAVWIKFCDLKGVWHEIFVFRFFVWISFSPAPQYSTGAISMFFENLGRSFSQFCVDNGDKLFTGVNDTGHDMKKIPVSKFFHLLPISLTPVINLYFRISQWIPLKFEMAPIGILRGLGETDSWSKAWSRKSRVKLP